MGINDQNDSIVKLDLELFQTLFDKFEPGVVIDSLEEALGSGRGDNYTAALYRVLLKGFKKVNDDGKKIKWEKSVICKRLPDSRARREAYRSDHLFRNEVLFYTSIIPELVKFQKNKTSKQLFKSIAKCYLARNDLVIMEDLRVRQFIMPDRTKGLTQEQMVLVLKELAKFHSLSLAYKDQFPTEFTTLKNNIVEGIFCDSNKDWYSNYYKILTKNAIDMVTESVEPNSKYVDRLKTFVGGNQFFSHMVKLLNSSTQLGVITHGDCWTNNFLYRYDERDNVIETCLVDFQLIRYGSVALDLANIIFCCTDKVMRRNHQNSWLQLYHKELVNSLKMLGPMPTECGTEEQLWTKIQSEWRKFAKFGLGLAMDILPISTCSSEEAPDLYIGLCEEETGAPELDVPPNDLCRRKMTEIVVDLVDAGLL